MAVAANKTGFSAPSWVVSLTPQSKDLPQTSQTLPPKQFDLHAPISASKRVEAVHSHHIETVFQSNGEFFSSSTTGLRDGSTGAVYVVGLYEEGLLMCKP
jgi:hypothetical protein